MKKYRYEILIFIVDAICMILELLASRVLTPYFGSSNIVWTSVIGIILLSSSLGNWFGGKVADKGNSNSSLKVVLILSTIFIFILPFMSTNVIKTVTSIIASTKLGAVLATIFLFFLPSFFMGVITPIVLKAKLDGMETAGTTAGNLNAVATIGGIVGTFAGGFLLLPYLGTIAVTFICASILSLAIFFVECKFKDYANLWILFIIFISCVCIVYFENKNQINIAKVSDDESYTKVSVDTEFSRVFIRNVVDSETKDKLRVLNIEGGFESVAYTEEDKIYDLYSKYTNNYNEMFNIKSDIKDVLMIGGGGYSYPKYYISHYLDKNLDVVEIDPGVTEIAKQYFFLDRLIEEYDLNNNKRLNLITDDGRIYLNNNTKKYDAILNDAFSGTNPVKTLTTLENVRNVKKSLNEDGLYLTNIISAKTGKDSRFIKAEVNTIGKVFKNVIVIDCSPEEADDLPRNNMVIASDSDDIFKILDKTYNLEIDENEIVITDDYCPVDSLIPEL